MNVIGVIPARKGSKGIIGKNKKLLNGKPLVSYAIEQSIASNLISKTLLTSDDDDIIEIGRKYDIETMGRPDKFAHDNTFQEVDRMLIWILHELEKQGEQIDIMVLLYPTAPLRTASKIDEAIDMVLNNGYDSVLSLYEDSTYLWRIDGDTAEPINYDPKKRGPRQKEGWNQWAENKAIYVFKKDILLQEGRRIGGRVGFVEMSKTDSVDIDKPEDFELCENILKMREAK